MVHPKLFRVLAAMVAILVIAGFGFCYGLAIFLCWFSPPNPLPTFGAEYIYVATALAGLVSGVVAMIFNEKLPDTPNARGSSAGAGPVTPQAAPTPLASSVSAGLVTIQGALHVENRSDALQVVSVCYVLIYFVAGILAIIT
jgi:hypothetical protein